MSKTLAVLGATGRQGGSVIKNVLSDPELSQRYKLRAITRDASSDKVKGLKQQVEVVEGDIANHASISTALTGADFVFIVTTPAFGPDAVKVEVDIIKTVADAAVEQGLEYIIFSTLPSYSDLSGGKYTAVTAFDAKAEGEKYIKTLPIKSAFWCGGYFMENFETQPFLGPQPNGDGTYSLIRNVRPSCRLPYIDAGGDTGKFVNAILAEPDKYEGQTLYAAVAFYSVVEIAEILSKATGKTIVYKQLSYEDFAKSLPFFGELFADGGAFQDEYGYFGPGSEEKVAQSKKNISAKLTTLEEYFQQHPYTIA
ncbi:uncharacterized protein Z520_11384 [Fonsecaea multimorphosa CBS 102226]|uniref:NmrA-like domain-containing protein n=1 Tax=Fonsecaea multimorphosa CBS 102226 TaxID=1442371 RepID=A0A0D2K990_9EURO|nr:uncharacterized protein Z520_11384 [Fonsecaea multimorphosa CBS 102226]KIX92908.1 hypothetical protein Z520_11384 [Fonsecaea multimorphosa CBS 102226]OAL18158.1 hypothetical protein AYO22_10935 [Fonsecaea multimorphosa]